MSDVIRLNVRPEVQAYLHSCEYVLALASATQHKPFSPDELQLMNYYASEVVKMIGEMAKV